MDNLESNDYIISLFEDYINSIKTDYDISKDYEFELKEKIVKNVNKIIKD